jgi:hypothetical protein
VLTVAKDGEDDVRPVAESTIHSSKYRPVATRSEPTLLGISRTLSSPQLVTHSVDSCPQSPSFSDDGQTTPNIDDQCRRSDESLLAATSASNLISLTSAGIPRRNNPERDHWGSKHKPFGWLGDPVPMAIVDREDDDIEADHGEEENVEDENVDEENGEEENGEEENGEEENGEEDNLEEKNDNDDNSKEDIINEDTANQDTGNEGSGKEDGGKEDCGQPDNGKDDNREEHNSEDDNGEYHTGIQVEDKENTGRREIPQPPLRRSKRLNAALDQTDRINHHNSKVTSNKKRNSGQGPRGVNAESPSVAGSSGGSSTNGPPDIYTKKTEIERILTTQRSSGKLWLKIKWKGIPTGSWELAEYMRSELGEEDYQELLETKPRKRRKKAPSW